MVQRKPVPGNADLPESLRVGPPQFDGSAQSRSQRSSYDAIPPQLSPGSVPVFQERNPARKSAEVGRIINDEINSTSGDRPQHPPEFAHLAAASAQHLSPPTQQFSSLHVEDQVADSSTISSDSRANTAQSHLEPHNTGSNPWGDSLPVDGMQHAPPETAAIHHVDSADSANDAWAFEAVHKQPPPPQREAPTVPISPQVLPAYEHESPGWDDEEVEQLHTPYHTPASHQSGSANNLAFSAPHVPDKGVSGSRTPEVNQGSSSTNPWDEAGGSHRGAITPQTTSSSQQPVPILTDQVEEQGGWRDVGQVLQISPTGKQESGVISSSEEHILDQPINPPVLPSRPAPISVQTREEEGVPPALPPRPGLEEQPWAQEQSYTPPPGPPPGYAGANDQKYQIKKITWHDHSSSFNPRISPILTQNANGPCPLLALVNAMILSTPSSASNDVAQYLSNKTEVSLDDLLQAIISEQLSEENCRERAQAGQEEYPDIGELHEFLKRLHTGMNVNPRFIPPIEASSPASLRNSMSHVHPMDRSAANIPGGFEHTKELELYASFGIRLIHGWLPEPSSAAWKAFENQAQTNDDAQLILLQKDELEHKLENSSTGGLTEQEAERLQDIYLMNDFLLTNPTQLTPFGLDAIRTSLRNGEFAILFRNSHFMVVYKHPETEMLFCLVTDEGYREHGDAVWESLMDCDGSSMEIFSGSFEILSGADHASSSGGGGANIPSSPRVMSSSPHRPGLDTIPSDWTGGGETPAAREKREREDADLAFALAVQDSFNEESFAQEARRRREQELSERFIESARHEAQTIPIERPEGGRAPPPNSRARGPPGAGRGGAAPIAPAPGMRGGARPSIDAGRCSPSSGARVSIPTRRRSSAQGAASPPTYNVNQPLPPIPSVNQGRDAADSGIPEALLRQPGRPLDPEAGVENPPPSYADAAMQPRYEGPVERAGGGRAVAGGVFGEAAGGCGDARSEGQSVQSLAGQQGGSRSPGMGLRETLGQSRRRVSEARRMQGGQQAGGDLRARDRDQRTRDREGRDESECVVM